MERQLSVKCGVHAFEVEYVCVEKDCQFPVKTFCQGCMNQKSEHLTNHLILPLSEILGDAALSNKVALLEKEAAKMAE